MKTAQLGGTVVSYDGTSVIQDGPRSDPVHNLQPHVDIYKQVEKGHFSIRVRGYDDVTCQTVFDMVLVTAKSQEELDFYWSHTKAIKLGD